jgi:hypothetical protein
MRNWNLCKHFLAWPIFFPPYRSPLANRILRKTGIDTCYDAGGTGSTLFWYRIDQVRNPAVCDCSISHTRLDFDLRSKGT